MIHHKDDGRDVWTHSGRDFPIYFRGEGRKTDTCHLPGPEVNTAPIYRLRHWEGGERLGRGARWREARQGSTRRAWANKTSRHQRLAKLQKPRRKWAASVTKAENSGGWEKLQDVDCEANHAAGRAAAPKLQAAGGNKGEKKKSKENRTWLITLFQALEKSESWIPTWASLLF